MARPPKRQETETFEITIPLALHAALVHLATHTVYGATENAVAVYLLSKEIERMQKGSEFGLRPPAG
jgi:hypothetical protein